MTVVPYLVYFPETPFILTIDSFGFQKLTPFPDREGKTQPFGSVVNISNHWSPTALSVPITLCDNRGRIYALPGPSYVAAVATGCDTSTLTNITLIVETQWRHMVTVFTAKISRNKRKERKGKSY